MNKKTTRSIIYMSFILSLVGMFMTACSNSEEANKEAIEKVLQFEFTGPDEKLMEFMWNPEYRTVVNNIEENKELDQYLGEIYGPYFTESGLASFITAFGGTTYQTFAYHSGNQLSFKSVTIEQNEDIRNQFTFVTEVGYMKSGEEEKTVTVEGEVYFSQTEEGKIESFKYGNDNNLSGILRK